MDAQTLALSISAGIAALSLASKALSDLSTNKQLKQSARVQRIESVASRVAGGVASSLEAAKGSGSTGDVLLAIENAAISNGADYISTQYADTLKAAGGTKESVITMLQGLVGQQKLAASAPALMTTAATALLASISAPAPASASSGAPQAAALTA